MKKTFKKWGYYLQVFTFLLLTFTVISCKKEDISRPNSSNIPIFNNQENVIQGQLIAPEHIQNWFTDHPMGQFLTPDWGKATQAKINGVKFVSMPLQNVDKTPKSSSLTKVLASGQTGTGENNPNYYAEHPPAIVFAEQKIGGKDSVFAMLLNFIPDNRNKEFGQDSLWTGKLVEWDMLADTVLVQKLDKSLVVQKYRLVNNQTINYSVGNRKAINSFWTWLEGLVKVVWDAINWIGFQLGIPGSTLWNEAGHVDGYISDWCQFLWGIFCGDGSSTGGGGSSGGGSGGGGDIATLLPYDLFYNGYVPGYTTGGGSGSGGCPVTVASNGKQHINVAQPGGGCPPTGDGGWQPYPISTPNLPQAPDNNSPSVIKGRAFLAILNQVKNLENEYSVNTNLTDNDRQELAEKLFLAYRGDFLTNKDQLNQLIDDEETYPPFITWLRNKLGKLSGIYPSKNAVETQQITSELDAWGAIGQRVLQVRQAVLSRPYNENSKVYIPTDFSVVYDQEWFTNEDELGAVGNELQQQGIKNTDPIPESYYKNGTPIDMTPSPIDSRTVKGAPRNAKYFWTQLIKKKPEMFSEKNRNYIATNQFKLVNADDQWIKYNPTHKAYKFGQLVHHHDEQGYTAYAIPVKVHQKWTKILHDFKINGKIPRIKPTLNSFVNIMQVFSFLTDIQTGNPDAWINWFGQNNQIGRIYKQPLTGDYYMITQLISYKNNAGVVIRAVVTYDVYADYIWDSDEGKYMGVQKLATFTEDIDVVTKKSTSRNFQTY
ncbi:hypothetical protein ACFQZI_07475 [Mucilaginibacter lutimaris]|uniref:Tox-HNH-HHH domain-containing protein n=1 Tax=Mucilaginibacter lutimaris TaxID=931629 RepID=A0ABW2ZET4_9SPHI